MFLLLPNLHSSAIWQNLRGSKLKIRLFWDFSFSAVGIAVVVVVDVVLDAVVIVVNDVANSSLCHKNVPFYCFLFVLTNLDLVSLG